MQSCGANWSTQSGDNVDIYPGKAIVSRSELVNVIFGNYIDNCWPDQCILPISNPASSLLLPFFRICFPRLSLIPYRVGLKLGNSPIQSQSGLNSLSQWGINQPNRDRMSNRVLAQQKTKQTADRNTNKQASIGGTRQLWNLSLPLIWAHK